LVDTLLWEDPTPLAAAPLAASVSRMAAPSHPSHRYREDPRSDQTGSGNLDFGNGLWWWCGAQAHVDAEFPNQRDHHVADQLRSAIGSRERGRRLVAITLLLLGEADCAARYSAPPAEEPEGDEPLPPQGRIVQRLDAPDLRRVSLSKGLCLAA
jgi:hypothetical protein